MALFSLQNPVARAEFNHISRSIPEYHLIFRRLLQFSQVGMLLTSLSLTAYAIWMVALQRSDVSDEIQNITLIFCTTTLLLHFVYLRRAASFGANTILREKHSGTWETLLLTQIDARQLVIGKWWAVVRHTWRQFMYLALLRMGASVSIGVFIFASRQNVALSFSMQPSPMPVLDILLASALIILFTLLNGLFVAATSVLGSLMGRVNSPGIVTAEATRIGVLLIPVVILLIPELYLLFFVMGGSGDLAALGLPIYMMWTQLIFIDNGTLFTAVIANPLDATSWTFILVALVAVLVYMMLISGLLLSGQYLARRQGAAHHDRDLKQ